MDESITFNTEGLSSEIIGLLQPATAVTAANDQPNEGLDSVSSEVQIQEESTLNILNVEQDATTEQYHFNGEYLQRDGQLYMILQNSRGENFEMLCEGTNIVTIPETAATEQMVTVAATETISSIDLPPVNENQILENDPTKLSPSVLADEITEEMSALIKTTGLSSSSIKASPAAKQDSVNVKRETAAKNKQPNSGPQSTPVATASPVKEKSKSIMSASHFANNHSLGPTQFAKSQKTYSRTSNIVWLSLPTEKKETNNNAKKLTTTIELAEPEESTPGGPPPIKFNEIATSPKVNRIANVNSNPKSINVVSKMPEKVTITMNSNNKNDELISVKYSTNIKETTSTILANELKTKKKVTFQENRQPLPNDKDVVSESVSYSKARIDSPRSTQYDFKMNDRRGDTHNYDYKMNNLVVSVRIQPGCFLPEPPGPRFVCEKCGFQTTFTYYYRDHRSHCRHSKPSSSSSSYSSSSSTLSKNNSTTNNHKPSSTRGKRKLPVEDNNIDAQNDEHNGNHQDQKIACEERTEEPMDTEKKSELDDLNQEEEEEEEEANKTLDGYSTKDVVWVETKVGFWPALIMDISSNEKKLFLRLIDCPIKKESLKTLPKSVVSFNKPSLDKYLKENKTHNSQLLKTVQKVEDYLRKRCLGSDVNPVKFFNFMEYFETSGAETSHPLDDVSKTTETVSKNNSTKSSSIDGGEILKFIKEGFVEGHLRAIYNGNDNERHKTFFEKEMTPKSGKIGFGPIKDEDQQDDLFSYCSKLYEGLRKRSVGIPLKEEEKFDLASYIYNVWIPEAIIKAISKKKRIDMKKAEELFNRECSNENQLID